MARNRRNQTLLARLAPAIKALLLCLFIGGSGLGYVWQKDQVYRLGGRVRELEQKRDDLRRHNKLQRDNLASLCLPQNLEAKVRQLNLGLVAHDPTTVIRIADIRLGPTNPLAASAPAASAGYPTSAQFGIAASPRP